MKLTEIAKLTGESNATIRKRKQRIIEALKTKLSKNHKYNL
jgi:DNA-directed RNA polymerase specialized sigma24 family protein